ncbi:hypothetical protein [Streptomyces sp. NPDC088719]
MELHRDAITAYERLCAEIDAEPAEVGPAWVMSGPGGTAPGAGGMGLLAP